MRFTFTDITVLLNEGPCSSPEKGKYDLDPKW